MLLKKMRTACDIAFNVLGVRQSDLKIQTDAKQFWEDNKSADFGVNSHWRGHGIFENDDARWLSIGIRHRTIFERMASVASQPTPKSWTVLEWGCGGGSNAIAFGRSAAQFVAVDISNASVHECLSQIQTEGLQNGIGVVADVHQPEEAIRALSPVNVVICVYVFEVLPSRNYALRLLRVFRDVLEPGGLAFIQLRYATQKKSTQGRPWGYRIGFTRMTTFLLHEFWEAATEVGFRPLGIELLPKDEIVLDERYAYFLLEKPLPQLNNP